MSEHAASIAVLHAFARDGYVLLRGVVPEALMAAADLEIDALVREQPPSQGDRGPGASQWFARVASLPACERVLRDAGVTERAQALTAPLRLDFAFDHIQVATTTPPWPHVPGGPHIDGFALGGDAPDTFTLLVGVLLSDQSAAAAGNLWVWPGSHNDHAALFAERGPRALFETGGHATLLDSPMLLGAPVPICGKRGDVLIAHYLLGHNKGGNTGSHERRSLYFRLAAEGHRARWEAALADPLLDYPAVRAALAEAGAAAS